MSHSAPFQDALPAFLQDDAEVRAVWLRDRCIFSRPATHQELLTAFSHLGVELSLADLGREPAVLYRSRHGAKLLYAQSAPPSALAQLLYCQMILAPPLGVQFITHTGQGDGALYEAARRFSAHLCGCASL